MTVSHFLQAVHYDFRAVTLAANLVRTAFSFSCIWAMENEKTLRKSWVVSKILFQAILVPYITINSLKSN